MVLGSIAEMRTSTVMSIFYLVLCVHTLYIRNFSDVEWTFQSVYHSILRYDCDL